MREPAKSRSTMSAAGESARKAGFKIAGKRQVSKLMNKIIPFLHKHHQDHCL